MSESSLNEELATELRKRAYEAKEKRVRDHLNEYADSLHTDEWECLARVDNLRAFFRIDAGMFR